MNLNDQASNTYSQSGEDGIIKDILSRIEGLDHHCCEFGAWDGMHFSNCRRLIQEENYACLYIEGNDKKFSELQSNYSGNDQVQCIHGLVGWEPDDNLDSILAASSFPVDFDFLSIDIDGNDYHVWSAMEDFRPKVIVIEFNPTIPTEVDYVQEADPGISRGCSLSSLCKLGQAKGYELVCVQPYNAFFVDKQYFHLFEIEDNRPSVLRKDLSLITWMFIGYDGSIHLSGSQRMHWQKLKLSSDEFNVLPRILRKFPDDYSPFQKFLFKCFKRFRALKKRFRSAR